MGNSAPLWLVTLQGVFIVLGFLIAAWQAYYNRKSRRVQNYIELIKLHRDLWKIELSEPSISTFLRVSPESADLAIDEKQKRFLCLIMLHMSCAFTLWSEGEIIDTGNMKEDFREFLSYPAVRKFWNSNKHFYQKSLVDFIECEVLADHGRVRKYWE